MHPSIRRWLIRTAIAVGVFLVGVGISVLDIVGWGFEGWVAVGALLQVAAVVWLLFFVIRFVLRRLLWRVGRRLLVSYLLLGLVPLPLVLVLTWGALWIGSAHVAALRVDGEIDRAALELRNLVLETRAELEASTDPETAVLDRMATLFPGVELVYRDAGGRTFSSGDSDPEVLLPPGRVQIDLTAIGVIESQAHLMILDRGDRGVLLARLPFEPDLRRLVESRTRVTVSFPSANEAFGETDGVSVDEDGLSVERKPVAREQLSDEINIQLPSGQNEDAKMERPPAPGVGGILAWPIVFLPRTVQYPYVDWQAGDWHAATDTEAGRDFYYILRTSIAREAVELAGEEGVQVNRELSLALMTALTVIAIMTVILWSGAALLAAILVWRIARATDRLATAFSRLEEGRFDHRAKLRGHDQLSELIVSYNRMAGRLESAVEERAEREALDRELATARALQQSLLPAAGFSYPGLGIATHFEPAQAIGGDFFHFEGTESHLDVVVADVSGHGLGTGIVMAAAKTLLSALATEDQPTVDLFERMDRQLLATTESRTFVTLVHCRFDLDQRTIEVTNAGHPPPYRVRPDGRVDTLSGSSRPLGLSLPAEFHTRAAELEPADLWVLLSDGIIEAESEAGEILGFDRWESLLAGVAGMQAEEARNLLLEKLDAFVGDRDQEDDLTLLVVRVEAFGNSSTS